MHAWAYLGFYGFKTPGNKSITATKAYSNVENMIKINGTHSETKTLFAKKSVLICRCLRYRCYSARWNLSRRNVMKSNIYVAPLQVTYSEALSSLAYMMLSVGLNK